MKKGNNDVYAKGTHHLHACTGLVAPTLLEGGNTHAMIETPIEENCAAMQTRLRRLQRSVLDLAGLHYPRHGLGQRLLQVELVTGNGAAWLARCSR